MRDSSWGSCTYTNRLSLTRSQAIQLLFFRIYRFKFIIDVLFRQEHNALKYRNEHTAESRTVVKTQQNWGGKLYFLLCIIKRKLIVIRVNNFSWNKKKYWKCYIIVTYVTKCKKFPNENGKLKVLISMNLISALTNKGAIPR